MNWYIAEFDGDPIEKEAIRLTVEIFKTGAVILFGFLVVVMVIT